MAKWDILKSAITAIIKTNGNQEITGQLLQNVLNNIVSSVGENATFAGIATTTTNPGSPDGPVFYLATTSGVYSNFGGVEVIEGEAVIFEWDNGTWSKKTVGLATDEKLSQLSTKLESKVNIAFREVLSLCSFKEDLEVIDMADKKVGVLLTAGGEETVFSGGSASPFIEIDNRYDYFFMPQIQVNAYFSQVAFYDKDKNLIFSLVGIDDIPNTSYKKDIFRLSIPTAVKYMRVVGNTASISVYKKLKSTSFEDMSVIKQHFAPAGGINFFDKRRITTNLYINPNKGSIIAGVSGYFVSDYIYIKDLPAISFIGTYLLYDEHKNIVRYGGQETTLQNVTLSSDEIFIRFCTKLANINSLMMVAGNMPNTYIPYSNSDIYASYDVNINIFEQLDFPLKSELQLVPTTFKDGVFGGNLNSGYSTSDYIEIVPNKFNLYNHYFLFEQTSGGVPKVIFYDKDKNIISSFNWNTFFNPVVNKILKIKYPKGCQYVRYARYNSSKYDGIYSCAANNLEDILNKNAAHVFSETNDIVWVGTSITEGSTYPKQASAVCGYNCINNSLGSQSLAIRNGNSLCMMYTEEEFKTLFSSSIGNTLTQHNFNGRLDKTFERSVLPYVRGESITITDGTTNASGGIINPSNIKISALVIDHNYNDYRNIADLLANEDKIDWESRDRTNFVGALNYLLDKVREINPTIKIVLAGYFQNSWLVGGIADVCKMQSLCAEKLNLEIIETWKYSQINNKIIKGTSSYMANFNKKYGTSYNVPTDSEGNISAQYIYLPDGIHPYSDLTGNCNARLNAIYTKFLKNII